MKKLLFILFTFIVITNAQAIEISGKSEISLLTVSPGTELYSTFGHSAIRIHDTINNIDIVFNYGTFNFNTPNFYIKFAMGQLDYMLAVETFESFMESCQYENRSVIEQILNLNNTEKQNIINALIDNYKPKNRYYRYYFFGNNCSTKIRDLIISISDNKKLFDSIQFNKNFTYRQYYSSCLTKLPWSKFGIDLLMGPGNDKLCTDYNAMFLPDYLMYGVTQSGIVSNEKLIYKAQPEEKANTRFLPIVLTVILLILGLLSLIHATFSKWFDYFFFTLTGLLGVFIAWLCFFSDHIELEKNLMLLVFLPTHLFIVYLKNKKIKKYYFLVTLIISAIILVSWPIFPQKFNYAIIPIIIIIAVKSYYNSLYKQK
jgi:hypothetical protein